MKPNIFICGVSGTGKSSSLRNLNPERTCILNTERKALPFRGAGKFKHQASIDSYISFQKLFNSALESDKFDTIVIESFTSLSEFILTQAKAIKTGFDVYSWYNEQVLGVLSKSKNANGKYVIFTGIDDYLKGNESSSMSEDRIAVKVEGQKLRGLIEKEFVIVVFTLVSKNEKSEMQYEFLTNSDGIRSAKSPMGMLPNKMPNDLQEIINLSEIYYKGEESNG
jgi:hypothetical protein